MLRACTAAEGPVCIENTLPIGESMIGAKRFVGGLLILVLGPVGLLASSSLGHAQAVDCATMVRGVISPTIPHSDVIFTMVTLARRQSPQDPRLNDDLASFAHTRLFFVQFLGSRPETPSGNLKTVARNAFGPDQGPKYDFGLQAQVFSDRISSGYPPPSEGFNRQRFDARRADDLSVEILVGSPVQVTITLRNWNNAKVVLEPTCEAGGFLLASTPDVKYLMRISPYDGRFP